MCIYVFLSLRASILRLLFQVYTSVCCCCCRCLSSLSLLMFLLPLFVFSFPGSFFGQLIASSIVVFHAYTSIFFSLIIYLVFSPSLLQVCIVRYQFYLCCNFGARMCLLLVYFLLYIVGGSRQNFSLFFYEFHSYVVSIALADTFLAVRYTNADCLV